jgi:predicted MPP superfamily phosphohydrolase
MYYSRTFPVVLGTVLAAAGYFWILVSSATTAIIVTARFVLARVPGMHSSTRRRLLRTAAVAAVGTPVAASAFGMFIERNQYGIRELDLPVPDLHPDLDGFRIVQVSDLHVSPFLSVRSARQVIDMANGLRADLAVFTGDLISEAGDPLDAAIRELIRLRADLGVLGCMGNHEEYVGCRNYLARQTARAGVNFLRYSATQIHRGAATLNIAGVDYQRSSNRDNYLPHMERFVLPGATNILLSHNPDVFPTALRRGFQTVLSGHTHGGQVNVEILQQNINPARFRTPYTCGLYRLGEADEVQASCFVTNGIGTIGMPVRLGAPPEIALLRLRRA